MTATLIAEGTIAAAIPAIWASVQATGNALNALSGSMTTLSAGLGGIASASLQADIDANVVALNASVGANLDAQISGGASVSADLALVVDAAAWLGGIVADLNATIALLGTIPAVDHLAGVKAAVDAGVSANTALKADFDANVSMPDVQATLDLAADLQIQANAAISAAIPGITAFAELTSQLLSAGVVIVHYTGQVQNFGADCDAAIAGSSLSPTENSTAVALMVADANTSTLANFKAGFGIS